MATFLKRLERLLEVARERGVVADDTRGQLLALARDHERHHGVLNLAAVLGWLGGLVVMLGMILLVAANWDALHDWVKIGGLVALFALAHGTALWIRMTERPLPRTAEALHFIGAGLFLAGIGLVAQVYHLDERPPNGVLLWLVATAPLAVLLRSGSLVLLAVVALVWWLHFEGSFAGSPLELPDRGFTSHLLLELGLGTALVTLAARVAAWAEGMAAAMRAAGILLFAYALYALGFYRYFSRSSGSHTDGSAILPLAVLALGAAGVAFGAASLGAGSRWLRNRLVLLLVATLALGAWALAADVGWVPRGARLSFFEFGWAREYDVTGWVVSVAAWVLWVALALWCVAFGTYTGRKGFVNVGVLAVGAIVVTRFFDLMGTQAQTGTLFLFGGVVLLGTGWGMERWRRRVVARMAIAP